MKALNAFSNEKRIFSTKLLVCTAMLISICVVMLNTPIGTLRLPLVSVTIAHIPVLVAALVFGLKSGIIVGISFGVTTMIMALTMAVSPFDLLFINPLVSVLPRALIPITTFFSYRGLSSLLLGHLAGKTAAVATSILIGNLTNTFGVYTIIYIIYAQRLFEATGIPALQLIITAISTSTLFKAVIVVIITTPIVLTLRRVVKP